MNKILNDEFLRLMLDSFDRGQSVEFVPTGRSMKPMLNGTYDKVTLIAPIDVRKHDVVLFKRPVDNALVIHRVIRCNADSTFDISGDAQCFFDTNVPLSDIYAVVINFTHNNKTYHSSSFTYKIYIYFILLKKYTRIFLSKIYHSIFK